MNDEEQEKRDLQREPEEVAIPREKGPCFYEAEDFYELDEAEHGHLGVGRVVEEGEGDHHQELLVVREEVVVVGPEPVPRTPLLRNLNKGISTSYS